MPLYPVRCPDCGEPNNADLDFCPVCGKRFLKAGPVPPGKGHTAAKVLSREEKLRLKKHQKKKELMALYKSKRISEDQFVRGMEKLGYSTDVEKVLAFKKFIQEQIQAFENMDVDRVNEGRTSFDENESKAELPRDRYGNVITDFSVRPGEAQRQAPPTAAGPVYRPAPPRPVRAEGGPVFADPLFEGGRSPGARRQDENIPKARESPAPSHRPAHRGRSDLDLEWDEDEEEFEIDLGSSETGWWDDEEWELDLNDEDEDWEDWEVDLDDEEDWESWEDKPVDDEEESEEVFDPRTYQREDEGEDDDWGDVRNRRRRRP